MSKGRTTDALDRWTISIEDNPRLAAALVARPDASALDAAETTDGDRVRALLAFLGALPFPDRGIVIDWLFAGRKITSRLIRDYRISWRTAQRVIAESGIEGLLFALQDTADAPADTARHIGRADPCGEFCEALRGINGDTTASGPRTDRGQGDTPPRLGSPSPTPTETPGGDPRLN